MSKVQSVRSTLGDYMEYCSVHGIGRVKNSPYTILKVFWVLALMTSTGIICLQIKKLFEVWYSQPVSTTIHLHSPSQMQFPGVTVCNINPAQYSKVKEEDYLMSIITAAAARLELPLALFDPPDINEDTIYEIPDLSYDFFDNQSNVLLEVGPAFKMRLSSIVDDRLKKVSQKAEDFILACVYEGEPCDSSSFSFTRSYEFGACYTFPGGAGSGSAPTDFGVSAAGAEYGLELVLNIDQDEQIPFVTESAGVVVALHEIGKHVEPRLGDIIVSTATQANIAVSVTRQQRVPRPGAMCDEDNVFRNIQDCIAACVEHLVTAYCGCTRDIQLSLQPVEEITGTNGSQTFQNPLNTEDQLQENDTDIPICHNKTHFDCMTVVRRDQVRNGGSDCTSCRVPCSQTVFTADISTSKWPKEMLKTLLLAKQDNVIYKGIADKIRDLDKAVFIEQNLVSVRVFLDSLTYETITEEPAYSDENFVSDIGGQLGLWLGFSVLSLTELVELVLLVMRSCRHRISGQGTPVESLQKETNMENAGDSVEPLPQAPKGKPKGLKAWE